MFTDYGTMRRRYCRPITWRRCSLQPSRHRRCIIPQAVTQSSAPEDGRKYRPKHVELVELINKLLLLHLVGC